VTELISQAALGNTREVRKLLKAGADLDDRSADGRTSLHWACQEGYLGIVKVLLDSGASLDARDKGGFTPLYTAVGEGHLEIVRELLKRKASPSIKVKTAANGTALHLGCAWGRFEIVKLLAKIGEVDLNAKDDEGRTPLFYAKKHHHTKIASYLLERGATK
jgi:ankyrin repeat protein